MYVVITENDESDWADDTGTLYHFPKRYLKNLQPGTDFIYYKGKVRNKVYSPKRLSDSPHYFGTGRIGKVYQDRYSKKDDYFAVIEDYREFINPVLAKTKDGYFEIIPANRVSNYWRDGVREIEKATFDSILNSAGVIGKISEPPENQYNDNSNGLESFVEGTSKKKFVTIFERNPKLRRQAIAIHGTKCAACQFDFGEFYGDYASGLIHIHHIYPVSEGGPKEVDPETDLLPLCANCHSVVHRRKDRTVTLDELVEMIKVQSISS